MDEIFDVRDYDVQQTDHLLVLLEYCIPRVTGADRAAFLITQHTLQCAMKALDKAVTPEEMAKLVQALLFAMLATTNDCWPAVLQVRKLEGLGFIPKLEINLNARDPIYFRTRVREILCELAAHLGCGRELGQELVGQEVPYDAAGLAHATLQKVTAMAAYGWDKQEWENVMQRTRAEWEKTR